MLSEQSMDGYTRYGVEFPSRTDWTARGWLLVPKERSEPGPAVVCLHGHGEGADAIVGLAEDPYQANFALQCVERGWVTMAVEQASFGTNRSSRDSEKASSCVMDSMFALVLGETVTGWRVRDAIAAFRALGSHPLVDPLRIATLGISGGGLTALWSAALEPEIRATGVSGYFCPMAHSILCVDHCPDNYVPGLANILDIPDLAGLVAPRALAVESGTQDPIFAAEGFRQGVGRAKAIYEAARVPDRFASDLFEGDHVFHGKVLLEHLSLALT
jgi:hypothetical protein